MPSIFVGKNGTRIRYNDLTFAQINTTTSDADAIMLCSFKQSGRIVLIDNSTDVDLEIWAIHPEVDNETNKLFLFELPAGRPLNFDLSLSGFEYDPGTRIYVCRVNPAVAAIVGKIRIVAWG